MIDILLVEEEINVTDVMKNALKEKGYNIEKVNTVILSKRAIDSKEFDLIILDKIFSDGNGFEICKYIRQTKSTPIMFLFMKNEDKNIVKGLEIGGDDYIIKPFETNEFLYRIKTVLKRHEKHIPEQNLISGDIKIDLFENRIFKNNDEINLTNSEYKLILIFMKNFKTELTRSEILEDLWNIDGEVVCDDSLSVYIKRLREKIEEDSSKPIYIKTLRGIGYMWDIEVIN